MAYQARHRAHQPVRRARRAAIAATAAIAVTAPVASTVTVADAATNRTWERLAGCEADGNWHINTGNGYYGGLQFSSSTWRAYGGGKYASTADRATKAEQIVIGEKVLDAQGWGAWPHCSEKLGLTAADARDGSADKAKVVAKFKHPWRYGSNDRHGRVRILHRIAIR